MSPVSLICAPSQCQYSSLIITTSKGEFSFSDQQHQPLCALNQPHFLPDSFIRTVDCEQYPTFELDYVHVSIFQRITDVGPNIQEAYECVR